MILLGLLLDGLSFLAPWTFYAIGVGWYSLESVELQVVLLLTGSLLTVAGLIKRGSVSVSSLEILMFACGFLIFLAWYEIGGLAMASSAVIVQCAEFSDPSSCNTVNTIRLMELLFWPEIIVPTVTLAGTIIALKQPPRKASPK
jgi:hypothetical protein